MTQTLEPGIKSKHNKGKWSGGHGARTTNAAHRSLGIGVPASRSATAPQPNARWDELWMQQIAGATTALLFAALAPALVMAALWHTAEIAPLAFVFTFAIALAHAVSSACRSPWCFGQRGGSTF